MPLNEVPPILLLLLGLFGGVLAGALFMWIRHRFAMSSILAAQKDAIAVARQRSVQQSRSTLKGQIAEQMAPLLKGFDYLPSDARFLGDPIDYVVFSGYTGVKDDGLDSQSIDVVILDIKRGRSNLTQPQRAIANAVEAGRVRFEIVRIDDSGRVSVHTVRTRDR